MVADKVPLLSHAADDVRAGIHKMPGHEKRRRDLLFAEDIQYLGDIAVIIPAVEGQVDGLFLRIPEAEVGIILKKRRIVGDGGLSAILPGLIVPIVRGGRRCGNGFPCGSDSQKHKPGGQHGQAGEAERGDGVAFHTASRKGFWGTPHKIDMAKFRIYVCGRWKTRERMLY